MTVNAEWHRAHRMPKNPTFEQRVLWHAEHVRHCDCRKPTGEVLAELRRRGLVATDHEQGVDRSASHDDNGA